MRTRYFAVALLLLIWSCNNDDDGSKDNGNTGELPEDLPNVENATFTNPTAITNTYYGPKNGETYVYEGGEPEMEPEEEIRVNLRSTTKEVMGVTCVIQHDVVSVDGIIIEDTDDWLAQDDENNLWYFGEEVKNYDEEGNFLDDDGSWEAGVDDALPGYWLPADPQVGQTYYQEYAKSEAEDQAEVLEVSATVTIGLGTYENCLVTKDYSSLEPHIYEKKYYAPDVGLIKEEEFEDDELIEVVELVEIIE